MIKKISCNEYINTKYRTSNTKVPSSAIPAKENIAESLYIPGGISFKGGVFGISETIAYRAKIAQAIGTKIENLSSILSSDELKDILKIAKKEEFTLGYNFENFINGKFKLNLHMHTKHSDGAMTVADLLNQGAKYADYRKNVLKKTDSFLIAITDHDGIEGSREAVKIIADNPEKYKNLSVVLGVEFNTRYNNRQAEVIGYGINPFDDKIYSFLKENSQINKNYLNNFLKNEVNKWEGAANIPPEKWTTLEDIIKEAKTEQTQCCNNIEFWGSGGLINGFTNALKSIFKKRGWNMDGIDKFNHEHGLKFSSQGINPGTPELKTIMQVVKDSGSGFVGVAHPCRNFGGIDLREIFKELKRLGIEAAESNYQYPNNPSRFPKSFQEHVELATIQSELLKTGGYDNHSDNVFTNFKQLREFPDEVKKVLE